MTLRTLAQVEALTSSLPKANLLTTLRFVYLGNPDVGPADVVTAGSTRADLLVQGLEQNESLLVFEGEHVSTGTTDLREDPVFSPRSRRKVAAYLDRNRHLPCTCVHSFYNFSDTG